MSKKLAGDLACKILGTRKLIKEDGSGFFYGNGEILLKVWNQGVRGSRSSYSYFHLNGEWYSLPVICCTVWTGSFYSRELYYTFDLEEICYEWKQDDE